MVKKIPVFCNKDCGAGWAEALENVSLNQEGWIKVRKGKVPAGLFLINYELNTDNFFSMAGTLSCS